MKISNSAVARILILSANPHNTTSLRLEAEASEIETGLAESGGKFDIRYKLATQPRHLRRAILKHRPHFVHYCGHGAGDKGIILEDSSGLAKPVSTEALGELFGIFAENNMAAKCVLLNACYSDIQARVIAQHVDYVVGMKEVIDDQAALEFAVAFYDSLAASQPIESAFKFGKNAILLEGLPGRLTPVLFRKSYETAEIDTASLQEMAAEARARRQPVPSTEDTLADPLQPPSEQEKGLASSTPMLEITPRSSPESQNENIIKMINTLKRERDVLFILGDNAATAGRKDAEPFPATAQVVDQILLDNGIQTTDSYRERKAQLKKIIERWDEEDSLPIYLKDYFNGEPGYAHYYLAALALSCFEDSNTPLFAVSSFDDLMFTAFSDLESRMSRRRPRTFPFGTDSQGDLAERFFNRIDSQLRSGSPAILKLHGDLDSRSYFFQASDTTGARDLTDHLAEWMNRPALFIGCDLREDLFAELILSSRGRKPIFVIQPDPLLEKIAHFPRVVSINESFQQFISTLDSTLQEREYALARKVSQRLSALDPTLTFSSLASIRERLNTCSKPALARGQERLPRVGGMTESQASQTVQLTDRPETGPDFAKFVFSDRPILAVVGDSGTGKSTSFLQAARSQIDPTVYTLFYDAYQLGIVGSLTDRITRDFLCEPSRLESLLQMLHTALEGAQHRLLILIDGINESTSVEPTSIKSEIEDIGRKLPATIKLAYSCRKVYWDTFLKEIYPISPRLYFGGRELSLRQFSRSEAKKAFKSYQTLYAFRGSFDLLTEELKRKIEDPLMLRMLAEGYREKQLPEFAPAVLIFDAYEQKLSRRFKHTVLVDYLEQMVLERASSGQQNQAADDLFSISEIRASNELHRLTVQQQNNRVLPCDPLILLEDEGILTTLDASKTTYRFTYDRFFEYQLGRALGERLDFSAVAELVRSIGEEVQSFASKHFSFLEALKSELIRCALMTPEKAGVLLDTATIQALLEHADSLVRNFSKDVLRELTFESNEDILNLLKGSIEDEATRYRLALDICGDSPEITPVLTQCLFSNDPDLIRRCVPIFHNLSSLDVDRNALDETIVSRLQRSPGLHRADARALIYYSAIKFSVEEKAGNDGFAELGHFWAEKISPILTKTASTNSVLKEVLLEVVRKEAPMLFGAKFCPRGIEYFWRDLEKDERELALELAPAIVEMEVRQDDRQREILNFFGSERRSWRERHNIEKVENFTYEFESRIAHWTLVREGIRDFSNVLEILETYVATGYWLSIDFAICCLRSILQISISEGPQAQDRLNTGFEKMKEWTVKFEGNRDRFYLALTVDDPFNFNFIPSAPTATVDVLYFAPDSGPVNFIAERLLSDDLQSSLLALLCTRYFWRDHPRKVLGTLKLVVGVRETSIASWLDRILKEIYLVYPRLVEEFFWKNGVSYSRARRIKHRTDISTPTAFRYSSTHLYRSLLMGPRSRRADVLHWYRELHRSESLEGFCSEFLPGLLQRLSARANHHP